MEHFNLTKNIEGKIKMRKNINEFLSEVKYEDIANLAEYIYEHYLKVVEELKEVIDNFETFLKWSFTSNKTFDISKFSHNKDYKEQSNKAAGILKPNIDNLINQEVEEREFYVKIWETVSNTALFATDEDKIGALIFLENCDTIPYFKLNKPLEVTEEEFNEIFDELGEDIQKCIYIFNKGYKFRTDVASQLLRLIENHKEEKIKVVLIARILHYLQWLFAYDEEEGEENQTEKHES